MGIGGYCDNAGTEVVELEAMRSDTFSWHPCQVYPCSTGMGLIVKYGENSSEEMIADKDKVLERIRVRSTGLQGDDCSSIQKGDHVLASQNSHCNTVFYDAKVKEVIRVRHSKRTQCRCSFIVKWLYQALEGEESTVPASAVMKLSTKSINLHPDISAFFKMQESLSGLNTSPFSNVVDSMDLEMDIDLLLDKQIKEISNSIVVSKKENSQNILFGPVVDPKEQGHGREIDASLKHQYDKIPSDNLKQHVRLEDEQPMQTTMVNSPAISSVQEKFTESRSHLNSLGALALIRSKFSEDDISLNIATTFGYENPRYEGIVKTLFPTSSASRVPSRAQGKGMKKKSWNSASRITHPSEMRLTRAQVQRSTGTTEAPQMTNSKETRLSYSAKRRRVTCTTDDADNIEVMEPESAPEDNAPTNSHKFDSSAENKVSLEKLVASPIDGHSASSVESEKVPFKKDGMISDLDSQKVTFAVDTIELNNSKRLTRSAVREEIVKNDSQPNRKLKKGRVSESNATDVFEGNVAPEISLLEPEKSIFSLTAAKISAQPTKKSEKSRERCAAVKTAPKTSEPAGSVTQGRNAVGSKKQEPRFSPGLKFLPRTRSQNKG